MSRLQSITNAVAIVSGLPKHNIVFFLGWKSRDSVPKLVDEYLNKKIMLDEFVTHNMPFEKINEAFDLMHSGKRFVQILVHKQDMEILLIKIETSQKQMQPQ